MSVRRREVRVSEEGGEWCVCGGRVCEWEGEEWGGVGKSGGTKLFTGST